MTAASRYRQSVFLMCSFTNGSTCGTMSSSQQVAISIKHTPAALHGFHSSSSSNSSYTYFSIYNNNNKNDDMVSLRSNGHCHHIRLVMVEDACLYYQHANIFNAIKLAMFTNSLTYYNAADIVVCNKYHLTKSSCVC